ncbi:beta-ketoacyl-ACP synthase II [candidate division KSB1 bacterium]|nr:beta-ketoacyl-ACP synthase II [candidate division KSB1 bacterium]
MNRKVVVTGMGVICPLGHTVDELWTALLQGKSGIAHITYFDTSTYDVTIAAEVKNFDPTNWIDKKEARRMDPFAQFALVAAELAIQDSGLDLEKVDKTRAGVITGSGIGGMATFEKEYFALYDKGHKRVSPFFIPMMIPDIAPGFISIKFGFRGPNFSTASACASSSHAIGLAARSIKSGETDIVITGGCEASITQIGIAGFENMKALSTRNDSPQTASRPFDAGRDGFIMGEGAGMLILESEEHALARGAHIHAEFAGSGFSGDAYHITAPVPGGHGAIQCMQSALRDAGMAPEDVDYVNAHGTSTPHNDRTESQAIKTVFGEHAKKLHVSSTKSMIGHLLGASGSVELIACIKTICENHIHPTANYTTPDPDCDLNYTPNQPVKKEVNCVISNSFGFGGHNVTLAVKKYRQS